MTSLQQLHQPTSRCIDFQNQHYLFFGGTAYLGLLSNPYYIALFKEGIDKYGLNNGTSRSNNVQLGIYDQAEEYLSRRFGFQDAAVFSGGYLAAQACVRVLSAGRAVFYAPDTHPALWLEGSPGVRMDFDTWSKEVLSAIETAPQDEILIVANALDNLTPRLYDFSFVKDISADKRVCLLLDDSHGIGVVRYNGISVDVKALQSLSNVEVVVVASLAKGMGTDAGVVLGSKAVIEQIKLNPMFMGASPCSPASMYALLHGEEIYAQEFDKLQNNLIKFGKLVRDMEMFRWVSNFPVFTSEDASLFTFLYNKRILISSFPYPLPNSPLLNRVVISSLHKESDLAYLSEVCSLKK